VAIITAFVFNSPLKEAVLTDSKFSAVMRTLYTVGEFNANDQQACQFVFESFLRDVFKAGPPFNSTVQTLLQQFAKSSPNLFTTAPSLQKLSKEFSSMMR
jgi:hypothetical protein